MTSEDVNVRAVRIKRPRDSLRVQYVGDLKVKELLSAFASSKRVRQDGFTLFREAGQQDDVSPESTYYLTWQKQNRGGGSVTTTEPVFSDSMTEVSEGSRSAREELSRLEDLVIRISTANSYLRMFRKTVSQQRTRVITLQQCKKKSDPFRQDSRGGMMGKGKQRASRWESTNLEQGLQLRTKLRVKLKERDEGTLQKLVTSDVVSGANGYALLSWETWSSMANLRSPKPLVIILPGVKTTQIEALGAIDMARVRTPEVVLEHSESQDGKKPDLFSKRVTVINVTESPEYCFELEHGGSRIEINPAFEHQILVDLYEDTAAKTQDWSVYGLRQVFRNILQTWTIDGSFEPQWPTVRYVALPQRATVVLRADAQARVCLLRASGQNLLFTRESIPRDKVSVQLEYTVVWLQTVAHQGSPAGVIKALATQIEGHYGICRNAKGYGIRSGNGTLAAARTLLRPSDASLNDRNRPMIPTKTYTLRGVSAKATGAELAQAVTSVWPILPLRQVNVRFDKATWQVQSSSEPPSRILHAADMIILVDDHQQGKAAGRAGSKKADRMRGRNAIPGKGKSKGGVQSSLSASVGSAESGAAKSERRAMQPFHASVPTGAADPSLGVIPGLSGLVVEPAHPRLWRAVMLLS